MKMKLNYLVFCVLWCIIFNTVNGQLIGDPAPGRSPGPPIFQSNILTKINTTSTVTDKFNRKLSSNDILVNVDDYQLPDEIQVPHKNSNINNNRKTIADITAAAAAAAATPETNEDTIKHSEHIDKLTNENSFRVNHKPCKNLSVTEYLLMRKHSPNIVKVEPFVKRNNSARTVPSLGQQQHQQQQHPGIAIDVTHDVFDVSYGLVKNILYTVRLFISKNESITDFYLESLIDQVQKGTFQGDTTSNSHRKHKQHKTVEQLTKENIKKKLFLNFRTNNNENLSIPTRVDESGSVQLPNSNTNDSRIGFNSSLTRRKRIKMTNYNNLDHCNQVFWSDNLIEGSDNEHYQRKWLYDVTGYKNKTVSFRILYRKKASFDVHEIITTFDLKDDCSLYIKESSGIFDYASLPELKYDTCIAYFPSRVSTITSESPGLLIEMKRLNVPCDSGGYLIFSDQNILCGKLEDLALGERIYYFPLHHNTSIILHKNPLFSLNYKLVDYCYNVTLTAHNSSMLLEPKYDLECFFKIHLPYGNQIELNLFTNFYTKSPINGSILEKSKLTIAADDIDYEYIDLTSTQYITNDDICTGINVRIDDLNAKNWTHCIRGDSLAKKFTFKSVGNSILVHISKIVYDNAMIIDSETDLYDGPPSIYLEYNALPIPEIVSQCAFGWIAIHQFCITAIETALPWKQAESECEKYGGHLASIKSEREQKLIDTLLMNSVGFKDSAAYWVGASDEVFEGDFRWSNGFPYTFSNWFPGWVEHNHYNKQPNDDGLSGQDCVELRRYFRIPPAIQSKPKTIPLTVTYMWNDRDCNEKNYFLCERPMSDEPIEKSWSMDCNKTIILSHNHLRASVWSPGFPGHYPDKTNCFTVIIAPMGHYIAIEFEEFVLENEPQCSYDYVEIIDSHPIEYNRNINYNSTHINSNNLTRNQQLKINNEGNASRNIDIFENFLNIYKTHQTYLIQTPEMGSNYDRQTGTSAPRRICGDWNSKVKLLRYRSYGPILGLHFSSDYSHHFGGYKAKVLIKNAASKCSDDRLKPYNGTCYLFVSYPEVDWFTAQQVCAGIHGQLASVTTAEEQRFIITNLRNELDYSPQTIYWLGGKLESNKHLKWIDGLNVTYRGWIQGQHNAQKTSKEPLCLGLQWKVSPSPMLPSGLFWSTDHCTKFGGYVCKKKGQRNVASNIENRTITGTDGNLFSPNYPNLYPANSNYWIKLIGPEKTRLVIQFKKIDLEEQNDCLYDYISIEDDDTFDDSVESAFTSKSLASENQNDLVKDDIHIKTQRLHKRDVISQVVRNSNPNRIMIEPSFLPYVRWCGTHESNMTRFEFISASNMVLINFHSDYSVSGSGFALTWKAVPLSGCPTQTYTSNDDINTINSPNYPNVLLNNLDCTYIIYASNGKRIWIEFHSFDLIRDSFLDIDLGNGPFVPFKKNRQLNDGTFVSYQNRVTIRLRTGAAPKGNGFQLVYKTMGNMEHRSIMLLNKTNGVLNHLNYPQPIPSNIDFTQHIIVPLGEVILLEIYNVGISDSGCHSANKIEIYDNYADINGSYWNLCKLSSMEENFNVGTYILPSPIHITSYLNTIHIRQQTTDTNHLKLNATIRVQPDFNYKYKLASGNDEVETCRTNPCQNDGKCISSGNLNRCQCVGHFTGRFCGLTMCEMEPCIFGKCELTSTAFKCHCLPGYVGRTCDQKQKPCADNPCESRGECFEKNGKFHCRCHAWWEGPRCERRMMRIPYKPLSERMLQEPFWLGLITVFVVMAFIGLVWCAKRHFPEKIEKLLAEEADRNRPPGSIHHLHNHHHPSLREQLQFTVTNSAPQSTATTPGTARTIFGRLGIRKPSILSLSSPQATGGATARTFSLDDLLRPPPRRTPSPARKKRNNSTPTKNKADEKRLIIETLIAPATIDTRPKMSLDDLIMISDQRNYYPDGNIDNIMVKETTFDDSCGTKGQLNDVKFEKKVTFARLLSKVSAEISSESTSNLKSLNLPASSTELIPRPSSVPPTPCANESRSPHSTSSNQGSDSLSGSEFAINDVGLRNNRRIKPKVSSADSILAMFRNFASTNVIAQMSSSLIISPSSTPSASSPQDPADDDSSTSSMHTPISFTSCPPDSPISYHLPNVSIEVPVLDPLNAHKSTTSNANNNALNPPTILLEVPSNVNKCLSPIRELPTPMPSPALTPIMPRQQRFSGFASTNSYNNDTTTFSTSFSDDDEKLAIERIENNNRKYVKVPVSSDDSDMNTSEISFSTRRMPLLLKPIAKTAKPAIFIDIEPPTPEERSPSRPKDLIIPQLIIQHPSPTRERVPAKLLGSPPPQRPGVGDICIFVTTEDSDQPQKIQMKENMGKPASLELPFSPPTITINSIMNEMESDTDIMSPANTKNGPHLCLPRHDMCYLSPFSIVTRCDRTISESNLSSSGYSSMASPAPSRCGSSNPLYPNDIDDPGCGPSGNFKLHKMLTMRRSSSHGKACENNACSNCSTSENSTDQGERNKRRSDSETLSDDILMESNDEGISTDHIDERIEDGQIKSAKELEHYIEKELLDSGKKIMLEEPVAMSQLQLPTIVIQTDGSDKCMSPVSSRSESPISERNTGMNRFSPLFYNRKEQMLPFTDSDGLYDFPSSDGKGNSVKVNHSKKSSTKKRERKQSRGATIPSPTKSVLLDISLKETTISSVQSSKAHSTTLRKSPKRRPMQRHTIISSSSSSESLPSTSRARYGLFLKGKSLKQSDYDTEKETTRQITTKINTDIMKPNRKINRLKAIANQIRFLKRLEQSLKLRAHQNSCLTSDSCPEDEYDDSIYSDAATATTSTVFKFKSKDTHLQSTTFPRKKQRSLSLNVKHDHWEMHKVYIDSFYDEVNSD